MFYLMLALSAMMNMVHLQSDAPIRLGIKEYVASRELKYESFHLKVINTTDSTLIIERVVPSCGCILVTVQKNKAKRDDDGDIYVSVVNERLDDWQPVEIEVYTNMNRTVPMKALITKQRKE